MNIEVYRQEFFRLANALMGRPGSVAEWVAMSVLGVVVFVLILTLVGRAFNCAMADPGRVLATGVATALLLTVVAVVSNVHLVPFMGDWTWRYAITFGIAVLVFGGGAVPMGRVFIKGSYNQVLFAMLIALAAAALAMTMTRAGFRAARAGDQGLAPARDRLEQAKETLR